MNYIIKRDGTREVFDEEKIVNAIRKAMIDAESINVVIMKDIAHQIAQLVVNNQEVEFTVEDIQDMVEESLMTSGAVKAAKKYILYRNIRNEINE